MEFSQFFVKRPIFAGVLSAIILIGGALSLRLRRASRLHIRVGAWLHPLTRGRRLPDLVCPRHGRAQGPLAAAVPRARLLGTRAR